MENGMTWAAFLGAAGFLFALGGVIWKVFAWINGNLAKLHERINRGRDSLQKFQVQVAREYVPNDHLTEVERRLVKSIDEMREEFREGNRQVLDALASRSKGT